MNNKQEKQLEINKSDIKQQIFEEISLINNTSERMISKIQFCNISTLKRILRHYKMFNRVLILRNDKKEHI